MSPKKLRVDGLQVRYFEEGAGAPLVLLHGASLGSSADVWARNLAPLAAHGLRVVAPDLPGFGETDNPADPSLAYRRDFVLELMDALGMARASLVGHSQSGRIVLELAFRHPGRVAKAVVVATGSLLPPLGGKTASEGEEGGAAEPTLEEARALLEANLYDKALATPDAVALRHRLSVGKNFAAFIARKSAPKEKGGAGGEPAWQRVARCPVPLLMLYGESDRGEAAKRAARAKELNPGLELRLLPRCAHLVQWDAAQAFEEIAGRFLAG
ncbi:MAG TPA: alpha/beta fold hydrolase [Burkholderiales bacterium]|nr:alpha/beta fold hydrolase [Burkholderiales bacterium]